MKSLLPDSRYLLFYFFGDYRVHLYIWYRWHTIEHLEHIRSLVRNYMASTLLTSVLIFLLLWDFIIFETFCLQEQLTFNVFLLNFSLGLPDFGKFCSIKFKNRLATLMEAFLSKGGFKQIMLLKWFRFFSISFVSVQIQLWTIGNTAKTREP